MHKRAQTNFAGPILGLVAALAAFIILVFFQAIGANVLDSADSNQDTTALQRLNQSFTNTVVATVTAQNITYNLSNSPVYDIVVYNGSGAVAIKLVGSGNYTGFTAAGVVNVSNGGTNATTSYINGTSSMIVEYSYYYNISTSVTNITKSGMNGMKAFADQNTTLANVLVGVLILVLLFGAFAIFNQSRGK